MIDNMLEASPSEDLFSNQPEGSVPGSQDLFSTPVEASPQASEDIFATPTQEASPQGSASIFGAPDDADDLYANAPTAQPERESALVKWEEERNKKIAENDQAEDQQDGEMKTAASEELKAYHAKVQEAQEKRAKHNLELDKETMGSLEAKYDNMWEGVVNYIDFNRNDLHEKDVSRMKSLLLQLKH